MTQDITRSFLAGSNDKSDRKKFDIYMEATLLAQSQENYQVCWRLMFPVESRDCAARQMHAQVMSVQTLCHCKT